MINRLAIIGIGLIGGSLARALRRAGAVGEVVGYGRSLANLKLAVDLGVVDHAETSIDAAIENADVVVLAVPVGAMGEILGRIADSVTRETVVTDVGSVKAEVLLAAREALGSKVSRFVPGHPIAGTEQSGVAAAREDLFEHHKVILTPDAETDPGAVETVRAMWEAVGGIVRTMDAQQHDMVLAASSHLPHVLAFALVDMLVRRDEHREIFDYAAGGFRDFTRIAGSDPVMWSDICAANAGPVLELIEQYREDLKELARAIEQGDGKWLEQVFRRARRARETYIKPPEPDVPEARE
ncbi:MAG: prephenate dehydrogenase/arogenate dehydrogenase family protein [Acidiferrobacteraceae bacterium]|jgi:prephenate dehydrogenase